MPKRASEPDHRRLIDAVARKLYGADCDAAWIPSDEADVFRLEWTDGRPARILKIQRPEMSWVVWREQALLPALRERGFTEVPTVEFTQEDLPRAEAVFMTMPAAPEVDLKAAYLHSPAAVAEVFSRLGGFLCRLGAQPLGGLPRLASPEDNNHGRAWMGSVKIVREHRWAQRPLLRQRLGETAAVLESLPNGFGVAGHGIGLLYDGRHGFTVVDWGSAGPVWPMYDLASAIGLLWAIAPVGTRDLLPALLSGFRPSANLTSDELRELRALLLVWQWFAAAQAIAAEDEDAFEVAAGEVVEVETLVASCSC